jgi:U11/U12 small nuclear ribonucleoprotein SNRNP65
VNDATLRNIALAVRAVPQLYVQVCHLMNKMHLPPPFMSEVPLPPPKKEEGEESELDSADEQREQERKRLKVLGRPTREVPVSERNRRRQRGRGR